MTAATATVQPSSLDEFGFLRDLFARLEKVELLLRDLPNDCSLPNGPKLVFKRQGEPHAEFVLLEAVPVLVGRIPPVSSAVTSIAFPGCLNMSRKHFEISLTEEFDTYAIADHSSYGTYVNTPQSRIKKQILKDGDMIHAGGQWFAYLDN